MKYPVAGEPGTVSSSGISTPPVSRSENARDTRKALVHVRKSLRASTRQQIVRLSRKVNAAATLSTGTSPLGCETMTGCYAPVRMRSKPSARSPRPTPICSTGR